MSGLWSDYLNFNAVRYRHADRLLETDLTGFRNLLGLVLLTGLQRLFVF